MEILRTNTTLVSYRPKGSMQEAKKMAKELFTIQMEKHKKLAIISMAF